MVPRFTGKLQHHMTWPGDTAWIVGCQYNSAPRKRHLVISDKRGREPAIAVSWTPNPLPTHSKMVSDAPPISLRDAAGWETHILAPILQQRERKRKQHWQLAICSGTTCLPLLGRTRHSSSEDESTCVNHPSAGLARLPRLDASPTHVDLSLPPTPICRFSFECLSTGCRNGGLFCKEQKPPPNTELEFEFLLEPLLVSYAWGLTNNWAVSLSSFDWLTTGLTVMHEKPTN